MRQGMHAPRHARTKAYTHAPRQACAKAYTCQERTKAGTHKGMHTPKHSPRHARRRQGTRTCVKASTHALRHAHMRQRKHACAKAHTHAPRHAHMRQGTHTCAKARSRHSPLIYRKTILFSFLENQIYIATMGLIQLPYYNSSLFDLSLLNKRILSFDQLIVIFIFHIINLSALEPVSNKFDFK